MRLCSLIVEVKAMDSIRGRLSALVGRDVCVALIDGTQVTHCQLVSAFCRGVATAWIVDGGDDVFVPVEAITEVWEVDGSVGQPLRRAA
jgi:hypothetical protein